MNQPVFLFDIDGVLVNPGGYRQSIRATLNLFTRRMGIADLQLDEETVATFESQSITSEWDIVPLILAAVIDPLLSLNPGLHLPSELDRACELLNQKAVRLPPVDLSALARRLGAAYQPGLSFSELALSMNRDGTTGSLFPHLKDHPLLDTLLGLTRDVVLSPTTRIFQQYALGSERFRSTYQIPAEIETESYLHRYDQPMLEKDLRDELLERWQAGRLHLSVYTIRPSMPRAEKPAPGLPYSPEANIVLEDLGLQALPLVGYGQICQVAERSGTSPNLLMKPSPIQALGAIGAAVCRDEIEALLAAEKWINHGDSTFFEKLPPLAVYVFEDSAGSIQGVRRAVELLAGLGIPASVHAWGIARSPAKKAALQKIGAELYPDINSAVRIALDHLFIH